MTTMTTLTTMMIRPQRWSIFQGDGLVNVFFLDHHCRQWLFNVFDKVGPSPLNVFWGVQPLDPMVFRWFSKFWGQWSTMVYFTLCGQFLAPFGSFLTLFEKNTISSPCGWILFGSKWLTLRFEETIANFQWFLRRPSPLNVFWAVWPLPSMVLRWFFDVATIAFNGFRWFQTIGQTMRWFRWIVVVYTRPTFQNEVEILFRLN